MLYITIALVVAGLCIIPQLENFYLISICITIFYHSCAGVAWNFLMGYAGFLSLGNAIFTGVGAYTMAVCLIHTPLTWWMILPLCAASAGLFGAFIAWFTDVCGLRGAYFTLTTILCLQIVRLSVESNDFLGATGGLFIPSDSLQISDSAIYFVFLFMLCAFLFIQKHLLHAPLGISLQAMRDDPEAAASIGVDLKKCKLVAMVLSALLSGITGAVLCLYTKNLFASHIFNNFTSIEILLPVILGGLGTRYGPIWGAVLFVGLSELIQDNLSYWGYEGPGIKQMIFGLILFFIMLFRPHGLHVNLLSQLRRFRARG